MFNFQKEVIINDIEKQVWLANDPEDPKNYSVAPGMEIKMMVRGGGEYFGKYIVENKVYKTAPIEPRNATVELNATQLAGITGTDHIQIFIELGLDNDYRGDFGSALWYFRKPIVVDLSLEGLNADMLVKAFKTAIPKEYQFLKVTKDGDKVVLTGEDCYIKIRKVQIIGFECESRCEGSSEEPVLKAEMKYVKEGDGYSIKIGNYGTVTENNVEFGTYNYMIHNLRLPTYANLRFTSPSAVEMPMAGTNYVQYSFAYCVPRSISFGGLSVAGQANHSTTLHTFFVPDTKDGENGTGNKAFEDYLKDKLGAEIVPLDRKGKHTITILPDSYVSSADLKLAEADKNNAEAIEANATADANLKSAVKANRKAIKDTHPDNSDLNNSLPDIE